MKKFTATQLNKSAQEVFAAVNEEGVVEIKHNRYPDKIFVISSIVNYSDKLYRFGEQTIEIDGGEQ